ncbi:MAG: hypothetical protein U5R46_08415 [Gammaproteobacteria bacterium]|nr:hypothetical protein [Gammaproteobacteria bacterium]
MTSNSQSFAIDHVAKEKAITRYGLPESVHVPIAAREMDDIEKYVGRVCSVVSFRNQTVALCVEPHLIPSKDNLPIWNIPESRVLHDTNQVWVHVEYGGYRHAYEKLVGSLPDSRYVLDHVLNRRVARLKHFSYLRIVPISRAANSSSGGLSEKWAVDYHSSERMRKVNAESQARIQYADLSDIVKMLNLKTGGVLQDPVNEAQKLVTYPHERQ